MTERDYLTSAELRTYAGLTERQLTYWRARGWITAQPRPADWGHGYPLRWTQEMADVAKRMRQLIDAGFSVHAAARLATELDRAGAL